ncbi:MFS transporter [Gryllotalpicola kribbensis]|uniref:MFS transporter n=1 Tax=Gryllotalpicola kribbensis TaxID=993084 RepID=A0ABP8AMD4_9MICO
MNVQLDQTSASGPSAHKEARSASASTGVLVMYVVGFFMMYIAVMTPVVSTLAVKVSTLTDDAHRVGALSAVTGVGAFFAFVANPIAGALSDRTTSRFGMRKPWLLAGVIGGVVGLVIIAVAGAIWQVVIGWALAQTAFNAAQAAFQAVLPDQVDEARRAKVSGWVGTGQNVSALVGIGIATVLAGAGIATAWMIIIPAALGLIGVVLFSLVLRDRVLDKASAEPFHLGRFFAGFWVSPRKFPDFGWAWLGRFLMLFGFASYNNYQLYYLQDRFGFDTATALSWQLRLMILQAILLTLSAALGGWLSDRLRRRKVFVIIATVLAGAALAVFALAGQPGLLYVASGLFGIGFGAYMAVDLALVTDVLPNRETEAAKNMGVFNIANALPQSLAPAVAPALLAIGAGGGENYTSLFLIGAVIIVIGAVSTMFIRGAR